MAHVRPQEVVDSALRASDDGVADAVNAARHGVTVKTIRRWRREYQRRGRTRGQRHTTALCPRCEGTPLDSAAYAELMASVKPAGRPHTRRTPGCVITTVSWKHWPCLFPQHGPGRKHERPIVLDDWQRMIVEAHPAAFLRGLFHSDGSRVRNWATRIVAGERKRYDYPRWQFTNVSLDIRELCCWALDLVDVPWRQSNHKTISVSTRAGVARLDELIGLKA